MRREWPTRPGERCAAWRFNGRPREATERYPGGCTAAPGVVLEYSSRLLVEPPLEFADPVQPTAASADAAEGASTRVSQTTSAIARPLPAVSAASRTSAGSGPRPCRQRSRSRSMSSARFEMKLPDASGEDEKQPVPGRSRGNTWSKNCWLTRVDDVRPTAEASVRGHRRTPSGRTSSAPVSAFRP